MNNLLIEKIAYNVINNSLKLEKNNSLLIVSPFEAKELVNKLIEETYKVGAFPFVRYNDVETNRQLIKGNSEQRVKIALEWSKREWESLDAECIISLNDNDYEFVNPILIDNIKMSQKINKELSDHIIKDKKWVLLEWPSSAAAHKAKMASKDYENFVLEVSSINYQEMYNNCLPLKQLMEKTDRVRIEGPNTNLTFSIKGINAIICAGESNIPDGEVFTAPIKESVNGYITYNSESPYDGKVYKNIKLVFKDGKIVESSCESGNNEDLKKIFDTDEGSRYIGEFALGLNPKITKPVGSILFDEKIWGSFHFTPGQCYKGEADNGNNSLIHWDLVCMQSKENGGGRIYFDDVLIREDGKFLLDELKSLNYDY